MEVKSLTEIIDELKKLNLKDKFDLIVGISRGGVIPAVMISSYLKLPLEIIKLNFRGDFQDPKYPVPKLVDPIDFNFEGQRVLLVDDRSNSGATLITAKKLLAKAKSVKTLVINGKADYSLFEADCFKMPWEI
ncbi:phosphoribosyltransferase [Candidatus Collierbacteria bacterium]|nr:phosphoribosyltransferase [Candidatus Collierbacteria bacterium]